MIDPEPPIPAKAIHQIRNTFSTAQLDAQSDYLQKNSGHYNQAEMNSMLSAIEQQREKLNPEPTEYNCARIESIEVVYTPEGNAFLITSKSKTHNLLRYCELAYQSRKRLSEYILDELANSGTEVYDFRYKFKRPTAAIEGLGQQEAEVGFEVGVEPSREPVERKTEEARINVDIADIFNRLQKQIDERFEELERQIRGGASGTEINVLRERINDLERERDRFQNQYSELLGKIRREERVRSYQTTLTAKEYSVFQNQFTQSLPGLKPYTYHKAGEGYEVRIDYENPEQEEAIRELIRIVHEQGKPLERRVNPLSNSPMVDTFCRVFEAETGKPCGVSRTGALTSLAQMILDYVNKYNQEHPRRHELDIAQLEKYIAEIDLFAHKGQSVYTAEQASEAFAAFIRNVETSVEEEGFALKPTEEFIPEVELCRPEVMYPEFVDVYVFLEKQAHGTATEQDRKKYNRALENLKPCGYTPDRYREFLDGAIGFFDEQGDDFYAIARSLGA